MLAQSHPQSSLGHTDGNQWMPYDNVLRTDSKLVVAAHANITRKGVVLFSMFFVGTMRR
jgi:hypothetical protein